MFTPHCMSETLAKNLLPFFFTAFLVHSIIGRGIVQASCAEKVPMYRSAEPPGDL